MTIRKKIALLSIPSLLAVSAFTFAFLNAPANKITFDVNPSIELTTNRLDDVIEIKPLNDDAEALLKDYSPSDRDLEDVVNDLVDRMILTGYISGGQDNLVMITVQDSQANEALVDRVNKTIAAYLENKQIEATVVNQKLDLAWEELNKDGISSGKLAVIETLMADDDHLSKEELSDMKVSELVALAKALDLKPSALFDTVLDDDFDDDNFDLNDDFDLDDDSDFDNDSDLDDDWDDDDRDDAIDDRDDDSDDDDDNAVNDDEFEDDDSDDDADMNDDSDDDRISVSSNSDSVSSASVNVPVSDNMISSDKAKAIALNRVNGDIIKLELDYDDDDQPEYEIKILSGSLKYEIEIDAVTGQILKVESESVLDDDSDGLNNFDDDAVLNDRDDNEDDDVDDDDDDEDDNDDDDDINDYDNDDREDD
ncbi:MAG: hypothetical protein GT601_16980 [Acidaminobacter sp.]|uniref:PepSY domain-containing protein n=1 Tax=Acidaminobacter sp. TaxID=1872102 RepID=UPI0013835EB0|nr:PepSY domain-containing protein [Acidaminobacter sp.]MZQ99362.1 hypothetical protein [Acidaminobacter sp.]